MRQEDLKTLIVLAGVFLSLVSGLWSQVCFADATPDEMLKRNGIEHRLGAMAALDTPWTTSDGKEIMLNSLFNGKPVILVPVYYDCPMLCQLVLRGLVKGLNELALAGEKDFDLVIYSIDPTDTPEDAAASRTTFMEQYKQSHQARSVTFLTGSENASKLLSKSIGFKYEKDPASGEYIHSAVLLFLSPDGKIMRYMGGIDFDPKGVKLALIEAANGKVGSFWDQILLVCYHYNPSKGKYSLAVDRILQVSGSATALALFGFIFFSLRSEKIGRPRV